MHLSVVVPCFNEAANLERLVAARTMEVAAARGLPPLPAWQPPASIVEDEPRRFLEGVERILELELDADEKKLMDASIEHVRKLVDEIKL